MSERELQGDLPGDSNQTASCEVTGGENRAGETKDAGRRLTRQLVLAKLAPPGSEAFIEREDALFKELQATGWLTGKARQMGAGDVADDVQQRVLTRLLVDFRQGRLFAISRGYLANTVAFECKSLWRKKTPSALSEREEAELGAEQDSPDSDLAEVTAKLVRVWERLEARQRRVLALYFPDLLAECRTYGEEEERDPTAAWTLEQIAAELGLSIASVHRLKGKAVRAFLDGLRDEGLGELADTLANDLT